MPWFDRSFSQGGRRQEAEEERSWGWVSHASSESVAVAPHLLRTESTMLHASDDAVIIQQIRRITQTLLVLLVLLVVLSTLVSTARQLLLSPPLPTHPITTYHPLFSFQHHHKSLPQRSLPSSVHHSTTSLPHHNFPLRRHQKRYRLPLQLSHRSPLPHLPSPPLPLSTFRQEYLFVSACHSPLGVTVAVVAFPGQGPSIKKTLATSTTLSLAFWQLAAWPSWIHSYPPRPRLLVTLPAYHPSFPIPPLHSPTLLDP
ncbi:hypothetical protein CC85DRAFT_155549 [Cutaneotrichosporon oleaginosum]|uniref:Uncharacterized protein n=1 Tax=Cutaneotrichosporon oleaginosum TaxID=879819 RepID=A0A0J0XWA9_9TREE|nr:uncharacterized protein CC85DRAFT_155549 [Cutaneotrichosporon oleaginosum]KLT45333.1 hypothetical protein CC85DRAFT_155549 [Cutaneotrichosporon oleaginosum]TXT14838.1 hypothetical protein COLE_01031 [Cutaneotrichosporon oleaginosum]